MAKYIVTRSDGTPIPEDEPCFIIRAQDQQALDTIRHYRREASRQGQPPAFLGQVDDHIDRIKAWQSANPGKMKRAD